MKIAHIAPPWIATPPKDYGGTERVIYNLVEAQVEQGHDVTLFAPGDARTSAKEISFFPRSLVGDGVPCVRRKASRRNGGGVRPHDCQGARERPGAVGKSFTSIRAVGESRSRPRG